MFTQQHADGMCHFRLGMVLGTVLGLAWGVAIGGWISVLI